MPASPSLCCACLHSCKAMITLACVKEVWEKVTCLMFAKCCAGSKVHQLHTASYTDWKSLQPLAQASSALDYYATKPLLRSEHKIRDSISAGGTWADRSQWSYQGIGNSQSGGPPSTSYQELCVSASWDSG